MERDVNQRFREFIEFINVQPTRLAADIGIHYESINRLLRPEHHEIAPSTKILLGVKKRYPELNMNWMFTGKGEMIQDPLAEFKGKFEEILRKLRAIEENQVNTLAKKDVIISQLTEIVKKI